MKIRLLLLLIFSLSLFAREGEKPLCPDYGMGRVGSMYTDGYGVITYGDILYWTAQMDGLDLALKVGVLGNNDNNVRVVIPDFEWDPAFRVGLGYYFKWRDWDLTLEWTRFRTEMSKFQDAGNDQLYSLWGRFGSSTSQRMISMSGHWDLHYDTLDLLFHPGYFRYKFFAIQPEFGVRGAWIDWRYTIDKLFLESDGSTRSQFLPYKNHFNGAGFLAGVNTKWFIGYGLQIYANGLASLLYGEFDLDQREQTVASQVMTITTAAYDFWRVRSNIHLQMGLEWERFFASNSVRLNIYAGYEFLIWFNQNQLYRGRSEIFGPNNLIELAPIIERDDLGINGLTIGARLEF